MISLPLSDQETRMGGDPDTLHSIEVVDPRSPYVSFSFLVNDGGIMRSVKTEEKHNVSE